jgi:hypothetical protein
MRHRPASSLPGPANPALRPSRAPTRSQSIFRAALARPHTGIEARLAARRTCFYPCANAAKVRPQILPRQTLIFHQPSPDWRPVAQAPACEGGPDRTRPKAASRGMDCGGCGEAEPAVGWPGQAGGGVMAQVQALPRGGVARPLPRDDGPAAGSSVEAYWGRRGCPARSVDCAWLEGPGGEPGAGGKGWLVGARPFAGIGRKQTVSDGAKEALGR